ncbi:MAG TPA: hypothetical protein VEY51_21060, partial [Chondromyces sp.]|nr:hypothetical protein [Chondromyces sp.]
MKEKQYKELQAKIHSVLSAVLHREAGMLAYLAAPDYLLNSAFETLRIFHRGFMSNHFCSLRFSLQLCDFIFAKYIYIFMLTSLVNGL